MVETLREREARLAAKLAKCNPHGFTAGLVRADLREVRAFIALGDLKAVKA